MQSEGMTSDANQDAVVEHSGGPLLVLGGPGTGKTTVLEQRYLRLAREKGLAPHRILLLCVNRSYAVDAKDRLFRALPIDASVEIPVYTWHALAYHLVTRYYQYLDGYSEPPVLLTGPEQWGLVKELLASEQAIDWPVWSARLTERGFIDEVADFCLRAEQRLVAREDLEALAAHREGWNEVIRFYSRYRDFLKAQSRLDYAGLIAASVRLLDERRDVADALVRRFPHVLVDDGQEMSHAQRELITRLETSNLVVAGDPDSGIETFRGAEPDWLSGFGKWFGAHETIKLERSHRLGSPAREMILELIENNDAESDHRPSTGAEHSTHLETRLYSSPSEEVESIARELRSLHLEEGIAWNEMAILISQPSQMLSPLERALDRWEVPYLPASGDRPLASEPSVGCFLDLARVSLRSPGWESTLANLITSPLVGLDYSDRRKLERSAWQQGRQLSDVVEESEVCSEFRSLRDMVLEYRSFADECFWRVWSSASYYRGLISEAAEGSAAANEHLDALVAFSHSLQRFVERRHGKGSIDDYLQEAARAEFGGDSWLAPRDRMPQRVSILSFHSARGREWKVVVVAGCLDNWIPKGRRAQGLFDPFALEIADLADREVEAIADDRRTFYVAATRATMRTIFTVSAAASGRGRPTRFLTELSMAPTEICISRDMPPLTESELRASLRRVLARDDTDPAEKVAAAVALSEIPGTNPSRWYGRWSWTEGRYPLAVSGEFKTSYSRLGVYDNCGLQYVLQSVLGLDPSSTESMKFGTWIHGLFEAVHQKKINDIPTLKRAYQELFDDTVFPNRAIANQYRRDGEKMLERFWKSEEFRQENVYTEVDFAVPFEGAILRGRIDRIDKKPALRLTDYKTARWTPSKQEATKSLQLAIYFLAARVAADVQVAEGEEVPQLTRIMGEIDGPPQQARLVFPGATWGNGDMKVLPQSPEQADEVIAEIPQLIADVIDEKFRPSAEADCHFCRMKPLCPLWPEGREVVT